MRKRWVGLEYNKNRVRDGGRKCRMMRKGVIGEYRRLCVECED